MNEESKLGYNERTANISHSTAHKRCFSTAQCTFGSRLIKINSFCVIVKVDTKATRLYFVKKRGNSQLTETMKFQLCELRGGSLTGFYIVALLLMSTKGKKLYKRLLLSEKPWMKKPRGKLLKSLFHLSRRCFEFCESFTCVTYLNTCFNHDESKISSSSLKQWQSKKFFVFNRFAICVSRYCYEHQWITLWACLPISPGDSR